MNSVVNKYIPYYTSANVGVLEAPDSVGKCTLYSNSETEKQLRDFKNDINSKQKQISFEDRKKTPKPVLFIFFVAGLLGILTLAKMFLSKFKH